MVRGDLVQILYDTGCRGGSILYGRVIAAGPKAYGVRWESGLTNRFAQGDWRIKMADNQELARQLMNWADKR